MPNTKAPYVIVVAVDYSAAGDMAFERALELAAEKPSASVHAINVLPVYQSGGVPEATSLAWSGSLPTLDAAKATLKAYVEKATAAFRTSHPGTRLADLHAHQRVEVPSEQVAQLAAD